MGVTLTIVDDSGEQVNERTPLSSVALFSSCALLELLVSRSNVAILRPKTLGSIASDDRPSLACPEHTKSAWNHQPNLAA
jgi:hypothetical protein